MIKNVFYITEKGMENKLGFRYEKNLSNISRTLTSNEIVTKLYVEDVDSELSKTGLCSIKTAEDNPFSVTEHVPPHLSIPSMRSPSRYFR